MVKKTKNSKKIPENSISEKYRIIKRNCQLCKIKFNGTRYQKWCTPCKTKLEKIEWDWYL